MKQVKKVITIILCIITVLLVGCTAREKVEPKQTANTSSQTVPDKEMANTSSVTQYFAVPDKETAIRHCEKILDKVMGIKISEYEVCVAEYREKKDAWYICFAPKGELVCGGDECFLISRKTGEILDYDWGE